MSGRNRKDLRRSNQADDRGSRPNSAHASGRSTPDPYYGSQPRVDPRFNDLFITDPPLSGQPTSYEQHITGPYRSQRSHVPQPTPYPSLSSQATPNQQRIFQPYGGQAIPQATPGGHPGPYSSSQPIVDQRLSDQSITNPHFTGQITPYQQRLIDPYGGLPALGATPSGHPGLYSSSQLAVHPHFGDQPIADPRLSGQPTSYQQHLTDLYGGQHFSVPQSSPYPSSSGQATSNQQRITGPYRAQPAPGATPSGHPGPYPSSQPIVDPRLNDQSITNPPFIGQITPYQQRLIEPYGGQPALEATPSGHPGPYSSSQLAVRPYFTDQPIANPRFSGQPTYYQQRITDSYGGQNFPVPQSSPYPSFSGQASSNQQRITGPYHAQPALGATPGGQPVPHSSDHQLINNGIYIITNKYHHRVVYLEDVNDKSPLRGHHNPETRGTRWHVKYWGKEQYSLENVDHKRYANCGPRAVMKSFVEGDSREQLWDIQARSTGEYTIATIDTKNLWALLDNEPDTPVELSNRYADPRCWWTFKSAETAAPVDENAVNQPALSDPRLLPAPFGDRSIPEAAIVEFISVTGTAPDLLQPLRAACEALRVLLQRAESIGHVNEERKALIKRLKFHLASVENDITKLEEDQNIDKTTPALDRDVRGSLETYARELKELLADNQPGIIVDKTRKIDLAFQRYTAALHQFAANMVAQMQQQLAQFGQEPQQGAHTAAEKARANRPNAYGIQHCECLPGTREKTLPAISNWLDDETTKKWIFFFLDVAGSGKSTVAKHMAEKWEREGRLLARFFFSRDTTETMSTNLFCSTVAGAFSALDPTYKEHMDKFMKLPNVELLSFEKRFEGLVAGPLRAIGRRAIVIIDALDECDAKQRDELLGTLRDQHNSIHPLRILATGRPERDIKLWAEEKFGFGYMNFSRLEENDKDVELYIKHTLRDVPHIQDCLYPVICHAEGLFIWARVACDLILDCDDIDVLLEELGKEVSLDYLYKVALQQSMPKEGASRRAMVLVLQMILAAKEPLSIAELELLSPKPGVVERIVTRLGSVLLYQGREDPIRLLHATFREFLVTRSSADSFFIQLELGHHTLASGCLTTISNLSKQDDSALLELDAISQRKEVSFERDNY